ncbi:helix-turn-helix domain-containing protein [Variovorax saccharolyticus]|uniref:helix-turn-helix domain-containing protein n=1 Tax=Variovorax saccharolyticus TaxID=3053516 RepID=UPI004037E023
MTPDYITTAEAAAILRTTPAALYVAHCKRRPHLPPRYVFGRRVLYRRDEVLASLVRAAS